MLRQVNFHEFSLWWLEIFSLVFINKSVKTYKKNSSRVSSFNFRNLSLAQLLSAPRKISIWKGIGNIYFISLLFCLNIFDISKFSSSFPHTMWWYVSFKKKNFSFNFQSLWNASPSNVWGNLIFSPQIVFWNFKIFLDL